MKPRIVRGGERAGKAGLLNISSFLVNALLVKAPNSVLKSAKSGPK